MSDAKEKDRVQIEKTDSVYKNNSKKLYRGLEYTGSDSAKTNIPLESRALVTEQQLNYLAKDIKDYLDEENHVAYYEQNPTPEEQIQATNNVFGDGVITAKISKILDGQVAAAAGITTLTLNDLGIEDILQGKKKLIILTPEAKIGDYGIPILSEFFKDVANDEVIYRKDTYETLRADSNWDTTYSEVLKNNKDDSFNIDNARIKNKYRFAEFSNYDAKYMDGLYDYHKGGSVPAFAEYLPFDWVTFIPKIFEDLKEGDILYQPSTGDIFEVTKTQGYVTCNNLVGLERVTNSDGDLTNTYRYFSIYEGRIKNALDNQVFGVDTFKKESLAKRQLMGDPNLQSSEAAEPKQTVIDLYLKYFNNLAIPEENEQRPYFDKDNKNSGQSDYYPIFSMTNYRNGDHSDQKVKSVTNTNIPKTNGLSKHFSGITNLTNSNNNGWLDDNNNYVPIVNNNVARLFYNTSYLNPDSFGEDIVKQYPRGAFAIHCKKIGSLNNNIIWEYMGNVLQAGGKEYPNPKDKDFLYAYKKILSSDLSQTVEIPQLGDYIYNPNSTELRRIVRDLTTSETGDGRETYLTEPVYTKINDEEDGYLRFAGTYLRGPGTKFMTPVTETNIYNDTVQLPLTGFFDIIQKIFGEDPASTGASWPYSNQDVLNDWKNKINSWNKSNILNQDRYNTKIIFNSLYLQNKTILNMICKDQDSYTKNGPALRFNQLNTIIPGDQILALTPDTDNIYNYRIYQATKAPYLYNIFRNENHQGYDTFEFKKMYVNFVSYCRAINGSKDYKVTLHRAFLQNLFITQIEREKNNDDKFYYYVRPEINTAATYVYDDPNPVKNVFSTESIKTWIEKTIDNISDTTKPDMTIVMNYADLYKDIYLQELEERLLNNYQCPIAVNAMFLNNLKFEVGDTGIIQGEPGRDGTNGADGRDGADGKDGTKILSAFMGQGYPVTIDGTPIVTENPDYFEIQYLLDDQTEDLNPGNVDSDFFAKVEQGDWIFIKNLYDIVNYPSSGSVGRKIKENVYAEFLSKPYFEGRWLNIRIKMIYNVPTATQISQEDINRLAEAWNSQTEYVGKKIYGAEMFSSNIYGGSLVIDNQLTPEHGRNNAIGSILVQKDGEVYFKAGTEDPQTVYIKGKIINVSDNVVRANSYVINSNTKTLTAYVDVESEKLKLSNLGAIGTKLELLANNHSGNININKIIIKINNQDTADASNYTFNLTKDRIGNINYTTNDISIKQNVCYTFTIVQNDNLERFMTVSSAPWATTTIIDGGTIQTGTVAAEHLDVNGIISVINNGGTTTIDGGKITSGSISADSIDTNSLFSKLVKTDKLLLSTKVNNEEAAGIKAGTGSAGGYSLTRGIEMFAKTTNGSDKDNYVLVTNGGIRLTTTNSYNTETEVYLRSNSSYDPALDGGSYYQPQGWLNLGDTSSNTNPDAESRIFLNVQGKITLNRRINGTNKSISLYIGTDGKLHVSGTNGIVYD